ncbi:MAG: GreA/GreB family elongation factor [Puniceicoccales bacterium]|jgi:transcription elongation factor GreA|nr:GreA/GreB family elongation factor [Puniceicoccales bacterium]
MDKQTIDNLIGRDMCNERTRDKLEKMTKGAYCIHQIWGFGQIKGYNSDKNKLIIDFVSGKVGQEMDPIFCTKKLEMLNKDDLIVRFYANPEEIRQQLKKSSIGILTEYVKSVPNKQVSVGDIERTFSDIVEKKNFKRWWNVTKKLIAKDPNLVLEEGNVTYLKLRENPVSAEEQIIEKFNSTHSAQVRLPIAGEISNMVIDSEALRTTASHAIDVLSSYAAPNFSKLTVGYKFLSCLIRDKLAKLVDQNVDSLEPKIESIIHESSNLLKIAADLPYAYYSQFFSLITRTFPDEWEKHCFNLLRNGNDRFTNDCIVYLCENGRDAAVKQQLVRWLHEKNLKTPLLKWIVKNRHAKKFTSVISQELLVPSLLRAILWAIDNEVLSGSHKSRKIPLAELVCEDRTLISDLLSTATEEEAIDLAQMLLVNQGFDSLSKKSLLARFIVVFPSAQGLIASQSKAKPSDTVLKVSQESLDIKKKEYESLVKEKIPANKAAIAAAREHGDLSENSEYKMARQDQETLLARKAQLERELRIAQVIDFESVDMSSVSVGSVVTIRSTARGNLVNFAILGAWDSDPNKNVISYKTPIAQELISKKIGDVVETSIDGVKEQWKIENIERWATHKQR